ncbi:metallophosphoesterase family protein [Bombilactobacillus bombi]|uniref:metallophosphoesterase family protein n=1 Tax=Bombilactobacillus bombi TaxID=1303590 RepID=UPI0015E5B71A|nr:metallophosphoesterase [Bombilactobacillus bombi]MBA1433972.1 serine/threonine protein phosphatase [Bombilactobacillus bombi]
MQLLSRWWQGIQFKLIQQSGEYAVHYRRQPYTLQVSPRRQILWPQQLGTIYYRQQSGNFQPVLIKPRYFVQQYLQSVAQGVRSLTVDSSLTFGIITDTHIKFADSPSYYGFNGLQHIAEFLMLPQLLPLDFVAHLGDVIDGSDDAITDQYFLKQVSNYFAKSACPYYLVKGNHDDNDKYDEHTALKKPSFSANTFSNLLWQPMYQQSSLTEDYSASGIGYFDKGNVRVLFINTTDVPYLLDQHGRKLYDSKLVLAVRNRQLQDIVHILEHSANKRILVCGHANLMTVKGQDGLQHNGKAVHDLFKAFNLGLSGQLIRQDADSNFSLNVRFDFHRNQTGRIGAYLCGHRHVEDQFKIDDIQYVLLNVSALMGRKHGLTTKYNRAWDRHKDEVSEFAGYIINFDEHTGWLQVFGYGAATPLRKFKI